MTRRKRPKAPPRPKDATGPSGMKPGNALEELLALIEAAECGRLASDRAATFTPRECAEIVRLAAWIRAEDAI